MSTENNVPNVTAADEPAVTPEALLEQLRAIRAQIPDYEQLSTRQFKAMAAAATVPQPFSLAALGALGTSEIVQNAVGVTAEELQRDAELAARWAVVEDELRAMLRGVVSANLKRRYRVGNAALIVYSLSKSLTRRPEHADLLPHVQQMRSTNRNGRRSAKPKNPQQPVIDAPQA